MIFIYGTASSGKSNIAENMAVEASREIGTELIYIATMENQSDAAKKRIEKHRKIREGKGFYTIEEMFSLSNHKLAIQNKIVLIECISNLCANIYFNEFGEKIGSIDDIKRISHGIVSDIRELSSLASELIIVSNNIFEDGVIYDEWTESYMSFLALVNKELASVSDLFYEVINGIPYKHR